jgi:cyclase
LVVLDVSATPEGRGPRGRRGAGGAAGLSIPLTVGGGVRALADVQALLEAGADKVSVNTAAVSSRG